MQVPDLFQHLFPRYRLAVVLDQVTQDVRFHERQRKGLVPDVQLETIEIDRLVAKCEYVLSSWRRGWRVQRFRKPFTAAQKAFDPGDQNRQIERLRKIVIRSRGEPFQDVVGMAPG